MNAGMTINIPALREMLKELTAAASAFGQRGGPCDCDELDGDLCKWHLDLADLYAKAEMVEALVKALEADQHHLIPGLKKRADFFGLVIPMTAPWVDPMIDVLAACRSLPAALRENVKRDAFHAKRKAMAGAYSPPEIREAIERAALAAAWGQA